MLDISQPWNQDQAPNLFHFNGGGELRIINNNICTETYIARAPRSVHHRWTHTQPCWELHKDTASSGSVTGEDENPRLMLSPPSHLPNKHCRPFPGESDRCTGVCSQEKSVRIVVFWLNSICFTRVCFFFCSSCITQSGNNNKNVICYGSSFQGLCPDENLFPLAVTDSHDRLKKSTL